MKQKGRGKREEEDWEMSSDSAKWSVAWTQLSWDSSSSAPANHLSLTCRAEPSSSIPFPNASNRVILLSLPLLPQSS